MAGLHAQPLAHAQAPAQGTLWDVYLSEGGRRVAPLAKAILSDANVDLLTRTLQAKAVLKLGALAPAAADLTLPQCDAFANALMEGALSFGYLHVDASTLAAANKQIMEWTMVRLTTEQSTFARWREFMEVGVNPAMAPRPGCDTERADRKELQHPALGHGLYNPWEAYAEEHNLLDTFQPFNGLKPQDVTGSDDMRIQVVPWAPPARHGRIPW